MQSFGILATRISADMRTPERRARRLEHLPTKVDDLDLTGTRESETAVNALRQHYLHNNSAFMSNFLTASSCKSGG
jgi:hypothetical protein